MVLEVMDEIKEEEISETEKGIVKIEKIGQEQIHGLLFGDKLSWQAIIYDLINTEQLDPWDIDICLLANKYLVKVRELEEANFFVSSKVLLAASLLLRLKSEILLNYYIPSLDDILFGKEKEKQHIQERLELDDEIPELIPRTPLPRGRKVTLQELLGALGKAIKTETRRIKRVIVDRQREFETMGVIPKRRKDLQEEIRVLYHRLKNIFSENGDDKLAFSSFAGQGVEERIAYFVSLLHLDYQHKVLIEQDSHFDEIWVWLKHIHEKKHAVVLEQMRLEVEEAMKKDVEEDEKERALEREAKKEKKKERREKKAGKKAKEEEIVKEGIDKSEEEKNEEEREGEGGNSGEEVGGRKSISI